MSKPEGSVMADGGAISGAVEIDAGMLDRMIEIRRHLHRNPELSNHEANTQLYLRQMLAGQGIADIRDVAGFGLAVDIVGTGAGPYCRCAGRGLLPGDGIAEDRLARD